MCYFLEIYLHIYTNFLALPSEGFNENKDSMWYGKDTNPVNEDTEPIQ